MMFVEKLVTNRRKISNKPFFRQKKKNLQSPVSPSLSKSYYGGASRDRTDDLLTASQARNAFFNFCNLLKINQIRMASAFTKNCSMFTIHLFHLFHTIADTN